MNTIHEYLLKIIKFALFSFVINFINIGILCIIGLVTILNMIFSQG